MKFDDPDPVSDDDSDWPESPISWDSEDEDE